VNLHVTEILTKPRLKEASNRFGQRQARSTWKLDARWRWLSESRFLAMQILFALGTHALDARNEGLLRHGRWFAIYLFLTLRA
jgi:hypothetical protein